MKHRVLRAVVLGVCLFGISATLAARPHENLHSYHPACWLQNSRSSDCVAAIHRYCQHRHSKGKRNNAAGVSQEVGRHAFGVECFRATSYGDVPLATLTREHPGCNAITKSQQPDCMAAIHRYCHKVHGADAGIAQEVGKEVFGVACLKAKWYGDVPLATLQIEHPGCNAMTKSQQPDCVAAIHRYCHKVHGTDAGIAQEVGNGVFGVACFDGLWYGDVPVPRAPPPRRPPPPIPPGAGQCGPLICPLQGHCCCCPNLGPQKDCECVANDVGQSCMYVCQQHRHAN